MAYKVAKVSSISGLNSGDVAISVCIELAMKRFGINVQSFDMELREPDNFKPDSRGRRKKYAFLLDRIVSLRYIIKCAKVELKTLRNAELKLKEYDAVIIGGGNMLFNYVGCPYLFFFYRLSARERKKNFIVLAAGAGPFSFPWKGQLRKVHERSSYFSVRDLASLEECVKAGCDRKKIGIMADPAFLISEFFPAPATERRTFRYFGVNVMEYKKSLYPHARQSAPQLVENLAAISLEHRLAVKIIITSYEDLEYSRALRDLLLNRGVECALSPIQKGSGYSDTFSDLKFMLSHRMHSAIFSLSYCVPTLMYFWQEKVRSLAKTVFETEFEKIEVPENFDHASVLEALSIYPVGLPQKISDLKTPLLAQFQYVANGVLGSGTP